MYAGDSLFTLTRAAQAGLIAISLGLAVGVVLVAWAAMRGRRGPVRAGVAIVVFALFVWLSPQIYYAYYRMIIDGLPAQWVIGAPPSLVELVALVSFAGRASLSAHATGILFWVLAGVAWLSGQGRSGTRP